MHRSDIVSNAPTHKASNKVREQWGYNDALLHAETGYVPPWHSGPRDTHFDKSYVRGYYAGMDAAKEAK